jgi:hypothetical protein
MKIVLTDELLKEYLIEQGYQLLEDQDGDEESDEDEAIIN